MFSQEMIDAGVNALPPGLSPEILAKAEDIVCGVYLAMKAEEFGRVMGVNPVPGGLMGEPTLKKPKTLADYFEVAYLKQIERDGPWTGDSKLFPTEDEANAYADILHEGRHASVKVVPRNWA